MLISNHERTGLHPILSHQALNNGTILQALSDLFKDLNSSLCLCPRSCSVPMFGMPITYMNSTYLGQQVIIHHSLSPASSPKPQLTRSPRPTHQNLTSDLTMPSQQNWGRKEDWVRIHPTYGVPVAAEQATKVPWAMFNVWQKGQPRSIGGAAIHRWINTNYFLWLLCDMLAEAGRDEQWTQEFDTHHRKTWKMIEERTYDVEGSARFTLAIPPPPVYGAVVTHTTNMNVTFRIDTEDRPLNLAPFAASSENPVWPLWKWLEENPQEEMHRFNVVLETWNPEDWADSPTLNRYIMRLKKKSGGDADEDADKPAA